MLQENSNDFGVVAAQLIEAACRARAGDREAAKAHIAHAMALLQGQPHSVLAAVPTPHPETKQSVRGGLAAWQARRLTAHIDANLAEKIRVKDLAALLGFSVGHFCRAFKSTFGVSAHDYLTRRRIQVAQGLMLTTRDSLGTIAVSCGMSDQSHFTRWFRRIVGETPRHWRVSRRGALEEQVTQVASAPAPLLRFAAFTSTAAPVPDQARAQDQDLHLGREVFNDFRAASGNRLAGPIQDRRVGSHRPAPKPGDSR